MHYIKSSFPEERRCVVMVGGEGRAVGEAVVGWAGRRGFEVERLVLGGGGRGEWGATIEGAAAVVNLDGIGGDERLGRREREALMKSRIRGVRALGDAMHGCRWPPRVWVQCGTIAIYGPAGDQWCDEAAPIGRGAAAIRANEAEMAFAQSPTPRTRRVLLRTGAVLGRGDLPSRVLFRPWTVFSRAADDGGAQFISWIHVDDLTRVILRVIEDVSMSGIYNATGPDPVPWAHFERERRRRLKRRGIAMPPWFGRLGGGLWRSARAPVQTGVRGDPRRLEEAGFTFRFPSLAEALCDLFPARDPIQARPVTNPSPALAATDG